MDAETQAFLDLTEAEIASWTAARTAERDLVPPAAALPGVLENLALLRSQAALVFAALGDRAGDAPEAFVP
ncbi:hypothetical protein [uncultured Caulobacter sp.]|uniref:hypothetical protein n=1 Tax=uncultured Caulobacter sp. TaxID=158749 RepID=UPI0026083AA6|nr:hypothetical protein [uncultured Caulobacter sp.]